jgi:uncharacterized protein with PQ loop repeat
MEMNWIELFGWLLVLTPFFTVMPQVVQTIRTKDVNGLSLSSQMSWTFSWTVWAWYGFTIGSLPVMFNNLLGLITDTVLLVFIIIYTLNEHSWRAALKREGSHLFVMLVILPVFFVYYFFGVEAGLLALAVADFIALMPQLVKSFKSESLSGLSVWSWWAKVVVSSSWIAYGFGIGNVVSVSWAFFMIPVYATVIARIYHDRRKHKAAGVVAEEIHEVEIHGHS